MKFQEFTQIMSNQGFEKLADIARELGVSPQAINNWKIRDQVPHKIAILIQEKYAELNSNINFIPQSQALVNLILIHIHHPMGILKKIPSHFGK